MTPVCDFFFATGNAHKLEEIELILDGYQIGSFRDLEQKLEVEETEPTLQGNAALKAKAYFDLLNVPCFADDTGLEVSSLNGAPGVETARYGGPECLAEDNIRKLLSELVGCNDRSAQFRTVIAWYDGKEMHFFEGKLNGSIALQPVGSKGFGYDPIFIPENEARTLAQHTSQEKNAISHRARALAKFVDFVNPS